MSSAPAFVTGALMRHVTIMSLTSSIGLMAVFALDFADMVFIAMPGNEALAAAVGYAATGRVAALTGGEGVLASCQN